MGLKAGLQILQQTGKAVSKYTDDVVGLGVRKWTKPTNLEGLRFAPEAIGDTVKISSRRFNSPSAEKLDELIKKAKLNKDTVLDKEGKNLLEEYTDELDEYFYMYINDNNSMFLERLIEIFPLKSGDKVNMAVQKRMIYLKDINHSGYENKEDFLKRFLAEVEEIEALKGTDGSALYPDSLVNIMSKKAILQAKYNNSERYQELQELLYLYKQGKVSQYTVETFFPNAHFHSLVKGDMQRLLRGEHYYPQLTELADDVIAKLEVGEAFSVGKEMFVKTTKGYEKLKIDAQTYERLFPAIERYTPTQGNVGNCGKISTWNALVKNPRSRVELYKMFEQTSDGVRVTIPRLNSSQEFSWTNLEMLSGPNNMQGCVGHKMLEYSYDIKKIGDIDTRCNARAGMVSDILGIKAENTVGGVSETKGIVTQRDGIFVTMPDLVDPDSGKAAQHIYSMFKDGYQNPWSGIEVISANMSKQQLRGGSHTMSWHLFD